MLHTSSLVSSIPPPPPSIDRYLSFGKDRMDRVADDRASPHILSILDDSQKVLDKKTNLVFVTFVGQFYSLATAG